MASRTPAIIGFLIAGLLVLGLGFFGDRFTAGGDQQLPPLTLVSPRSGDSVANPVMLQFRTPAQLELHSGMGWMAGELHLHAMVDGTEVMPAAADIRAAGDGWEWQLPPLEPGNRQVHLSWAGRHHGNLTTPSDTARIHVLP